MPPDAAEGSIYSDSALADMATVQEAMDEWRVQNDPASDYGPTMAEYVVTKLYSLGRLS